MAINYHFLTMTDEHTEAAAKLRNTFREHGFYSRMGEEFWRIFMDGIVNSDEAIAFVAIPEDSQEIVGYILGSPNIIKLRAQIQKSKRMEFVKATIKVLLKNPGLFTSLIKEVLEPGEQNLDIPQSRWISWVVDEKHRRSGVGVELYNLLSDAMYKKGITKFYGTVDSLNEPSNLAHLKLGAENTGTVYLNGVEHIIWSHIAKPSSSKST